MAIKSAQLLCIIGSSAGKAFENSIPSALAWMAGKAMDGNRWASPIIWASMERITAFLKEPCLPMP